MDSIFMGYKKNHYIQDATDNAATNLKWDSTTVQDYTVPGGKRWFLLPSHVILDASATCVIYHEDIAGKSVSLLANYSAGTGAKGYPNYSVTGKGPTILDAGEVIAITCGAAQGAGAKASCVVIEVTVA